MLHLYDPRTNILTETTYDYLKELTGKNKGYLYSLKCKSTKIHNIGCYLTDENTTVKQRKVWYEKEKYHNEMWLPVRGSDGKYLVSNYGRFKRIYKKHSKFLLPYLHKRYGHLRIKVKFDGVHKDYKVGHLVALHFLGEPEPGQVLFHKNLIITDDWVGNLEYISKSKLGKRTGQLSRGRAVVQLDPMTEEVINEFRSAREAGRQTFMSYQAVLDRCNGLRKNSYGYMFMWADEYEKKYLSGEGIA